MFNRIFKTRQQNRPIKIDTTASLSPKQKQQAAVREALLGILPRPLNDIISDYIIPSDTAITQNEKQKEAIIDGVLHSGLPNPIIRIISEYNDRYQDLLFNYDEKSDYVYIMQLESLIDNIIQGNEDKQNKSLSAIKIAAIKAIQAGFIKSIQFLIEKKHLTDISADAVIKTDNGETTLLIEAIKSRQLGIAFFLLENYEMSHSTLNKVDSTRTAYGRLYSAIKYAISIGNTELLSLLLKKGADPDDLRRSASYTSSAIVDVVNQKYFGNKNKLEMIKALLPYTRIKFHELSHVDQQILKEFFATNISEYREVLNQIISKEENESLKANSANCIIM